MSACNRGSRAPISPVNVNDLIGIPWKRDGMCLEDGGLNCWGLGRIISGRMGRTIPAFDSYVDLLAENIGDQLREGFEKFSGLFESVETPEAGDFVYFESGSDCHLGVMISATAFVHSREHIGVCKSRINSLTFKRIKKGFFRWKE